MRGMTNFSWDWDGIRDEIGGWESKKLKSAAFRPWREEGDDLFYFVAAAVNLYRKLKQNIYN